jgi:hypothetical protein
MNLRAILRTAAFVSLDAIDDALVRSPHLLKLLALEKDGSAMEKNYAIRKNGPPLKTTLGFVFNAVFQTLSLPPVLRKKAEVAARMATKKFREPKLKPTNFTGWEEDTEAKFKEEMDFIHKHLDLFEACKKVGVPHSEEGEGATKLKAGPFTLVNTGGFSEEVMKGMQDFALTVASILTSAGLGKVCYGDLSITNQVHSKSDAAAFYAHISDEVYLRADKTGMHGMHGHLRTFIHELGHRYHNKVLKNVGLKELYDTILQQDDFITPYAKTSSGENYAELFAFYALGKLNPRQKELFEKVTF